MKMKTISDIVLGYLSRSKDGESKISLTLEDGQIMSFLSEEGCPSSCADDDKLISVCDSSTSTYDLSTYVWGTGGIGIADVNTSWQNEGQFSKRTKVRVDESLPIVMRNSSTSTYDLHTYIWDTAGSMVADEENLSASPSSDGLAIPAVVVAHRSSIEFVGQYLCNVSSRLPSHFTMDERVDTVVAVDKRATLLGGRKSMDTLVPVASEVITSRHTESVDTLVAGGNRVAPLESKKDLDDSVVAGYDSVTHLREKQRVDTLHTADDGAIPLVGRKRAQNFSKSSISAPPKKKRTRS